MTRIRPFAIALSFAISFAAQAQMPLAPDTPAEDAWLAPAPWLDPEAPAPVAPYAGPKAVIAVPAIDTSNLAAVVAAYNVYYNVAMPAVGFTGSTAGCNPGAISLAFQEWTISRINYLRAMAGVPGNTTLNGAINGQEQAAALIMAANGTLTHSPASNMLCYTAAGAAGAGSSNLALGGFTDSIPLYMSDPGSGNEIAGHRRWILHSRKSSFGLGQASGGTNANALEVFNSGAAAPSLPNGIPWPPRGYVPLAIFPASLRWSFGLPGANFAAANVTMSVNGNPLAATVISRTANGYGDNTIVWSLPGGHSVTKGSVYTVAISGITGAASSTYAYEVRPIDPADTVLPPSRLGNISTRMQVLTGNDVLIGGFIIQGAAAKQVVVRARGPSLVPFGIANAIANPRLELYSGPTVIASNDDWGAAGNAAALQATGFAPSSAQEAAILTTLAPGAYTAIVSGVGNTTGVGIVEVFEVDLPDSPLANISTRGQVLTGNDVMIGGFVIQGQSPQTVVIRARGPSLAAAGIPNPLANPVLQLFSGATVIASNDDWGTAANAAIVQSSGFAPSNALESAIRITLNPGAYTAIVTGTGGGTGVGIIEVFAQ
ncbi:MAG: hypothetical protein IPJ28_14645 [Betaproteobacteria bacterium]|nr:hypothetical protein [Betaproteobacteria bacterium]